MSTQDLFGWRNFSPDSDRDRVFKSRAESSARWVFDQGISVDDTSREEPEYRRGFMDRAFSMFNAPQQFLFKLTQEVAKDGFQASDVWSALSHGAEYFNPFSNSKYIDADEIRQVFFGPSGENAKRSFGEGAANFAFSLFYDPLWMLAPVGMAAKAGKITQGTANVASRILNPGSVAFDAIGMGGRTMGKGAQAVLNAAIGPEKASEFTNKLLRWTTDRYAGIDSGAREIIERAKLGIQEHFRDASIMIREIDKVSPDGQRLVMQMIESEAVRNARMFATPSQLEREGLSLGVRPFGKKVTEELRPGQVREVQELLAEADRLGIDRALLWETYDGVQRSYMGMTDGLLRQGLIPPEEHAQLIGNYTRRTYDAMENRDMVLSRWDQLRRRASAGDSEVSRYMDDMQILNPLEFRRRLTDLSAEIEKADLKRIPLPMGADAGPLAGRAITGAMNPAYELFPVSAVTGRRTLDVDGLISRVGEYGRNNPLASTDDVLEFVRREIIGPMPSSARGWAEIPPKINQAIAEAITGSKQTVKGIDSWGKLFRDWTPSSVDPVQFKEYRLNLERIATRENIPEFIRRELLGEVRDLSQNVASVALVAGKQLEFSKMLDEFAGLVRVDPSLQTAIRKAASSPQGIPSDLIQRLATETGRNADELQPLITEMLEPVQKMWVPTKTGKLRAVRVSPELQSAVQSNIRNGTPIPEDLLAALSKRTKIPVEELPARLREIGSEVDLTVGSPLTVGGKAPGTRWASPERSEIHTVHIPNLPDEFHGLADMWVSPSLKAILDNTRTVVDKSAGLTPENAISKIADGLEAFTRFFKFVKIPASPSANVRDTVSALMQIDITTGLPFSVPRFLKATKATMDFHQGKPSVYHQMAKLIGYDLGGYGMYASEISEVANSVKQAARRGAKKEGWWDDAAEMLAPVTDFMGKMKDGISLQYQLRENLLRTYVFSQKADELLANLGKSGVDVTLPEVQRQVARQAAAITDRALFNYADVPYAVEFARKYGVAPFLTFPFKAVPQLVGALYETPHRLLKYERGATQWNVNWAGGSEAFAAEVAALPDHKREAMVVRMPFSDLDNNPLYLDLSYFLPWYVINDLYKDAKGMVNQGTGVDVLPEERMGAIAGDAGGRSGIFTAIWGQLYDAFSRNQDGLGREIYKPTDDTNTKWLKLGRFMYQFLTPPDFPGGSTADSVGKSLQAVARASEEPVNWLDWVGTSMRTLSLFGDQNDALNRYNERPATRALAGGGANLQGLGRLATLGVIPAPDETSNANPTLQLLGGLSGLFVNVSTSDEGRQSRNALIERDMTATEIQRLIAQTRQNRNLSAEERNAEVRRLYGLLTTVRNTTRDSILRMRQ
jgi:hypothetical protein